MAWGDARTKSPCGSLQEDFSLNDPDRPGGQGATLARAIDADAVLKTEQRRMVGAHQDLGLIGMDRAGNEVEWYREVRAAVHVSPDLRAAAHQDQVFGGGVMWSGSHMFLIAVLVLLHRATASEGGKAGAPARPIV